MSNIDLVRRFIGAWEARSVEDVVVMMTPDAVYKNSGLPDYVGHDQIRAFVGGFLAKSTYVQFKVHHIAETADGTVLTERTDEFRLDEGLLSVPVMGVFEFQDGLISGWRDYFDPGVIGTAGA